MTINDVVQVATILGVLLSLYISWTKRAPEIRVIDSTADVNVAQARKADAEANLLINQRLVILEKDLAEACTELDTLREQSRKELEDTRANFLDQINEMASRLANQETEINLLRDWSERLVHQLKSIDPEVIPVPFKRPGKGTQPLSSKGMPS